MKSILLFGVALVALGACAGQENQAPSAGEDAPVEHQDDALCTDADANCGYWASIGECANNPGYMLESCCASCGGSSGGACTDQNESCGYWASTGECAKNPGYMQESCCASCQSAGGGPVDPGPSTGPFTCATRASEVPADVRSRLQLDGFYQKYVDANGIPILSSPNVDDRALVEACKFVTDMVSKRDDVRRRLVANGVRFAIIGKDEGTADIPEYGYRDKSQEERDAINQRARGLGGQVGSCGEENILCLPSDRYWDESICVHEFAHTMSLYGLYAADATFESRLRQTFDAARSQGLFADTYAMTNEQEYWAEGVQDWYDTNAEAIPTNGIHNDINTRGELQGYDRRLYDLVSELAPEAAQFTDCHRR